MTDWRAWNWTIIMRRWRKIEATLAVMASAYGSYRWRESAKNERRGVQWAKGEKYQLAAWRQNSSENGGKISKSGSSDISIENNGAGVLAWRRRRSGAKWWRWYMKNISYHQRAAEASAKRQRAMKDIAD